VEEREEARVGGEGEPREALVGDLAGGDRRGDEEDDAGPEGVERRQRLGPQRPRAVDRPLRLGAEEEPLAGDRPGGRTERPGIETVGAAAPRPQRERRAAEGEPRGEGAEDQAADPELALVLDEDRLGEAAPLLGG